MEPNPPRLIDDGEDDVREGDELPPPPLVVVRAPDPPHSHVLDRDREYEPAGGASGAHAPFTNTHGRWCRSYGTCGSGIGRPCASSTLLPFASSFHRS